MIEKIIVRHKMIVVKTYGALEKVTQYSVQEESSMQPPDALRC